jgi:hypothetical protein
VTMNAMSAISFSHSAWLMPRLNHSLARLTAERCGLFPGIVGYSFFVPCDLTKRANRVVGTSVTPRNFPRSRIRIRRQ